MSFPRNPLDKYRSYSYHNILLVANNTESLRPYLSADPTLDAAAMTAIQATAQGEAINVPGVAGQTFLVLDSRRTSNFSIREFNYTTAPGVGTASQTHIYVGTLNMVIVDPDGINFINYLRYLVDEKLKSDFFGIHFVLKTIFVGHTHDDTTEVVTTSAIPLMMHDLEFDVSYREGIYNLKFVPLMQNVAVMVKQYAIVNNARSIQAEDGKLGTIIKSFENRLNESYRDWYQKCNIAIKKAGDTDEQQIGKTGRLVQVMITIPKEWEQFPVDANFDQTIERNFAAEKKKRDEEAKAKQDAADKEREKQISDAVKAGETKEKAESRIKRQIISFNPVMTVYDILADIFKLCPEVNKLAAKKAVEDNKVKLFKTLSSITSNEEVIVVHFDCVEFEVPNVTLDKDKSSNFDKWFTTTAAGERMPLNSLTFDYIFSGRNTDILDFSLKMQMGQLLLMNNATKMGTTAHRAVNNQKSQADAPETLEKKNTVFVRENDPITFPPQTNDQRTNFAFMQEKVNVDAQRQHQKDRTEWLSAVAFMHGSSSLNVKMNIRGNPNLLNKYVVDTIQEHCVPENIKLVDLLKDEKSFRENSVLGNDQAWQDKKQKYREALDKYFADNVIAAFKEQTVNESDINGPKAHTYPFFVKVNVFAPNTLDFGSTTRTLDGSTGTYTKFWYDGWYMVFQIDSKFADGVFTQELTIGAFDLYGPETSTTTGGASTTPPKEEKSNE